MAGTYYFFQARSAVAYDFDDSDNTARASSKDRDLSSVLGTNTILGATATDSRIALVSGSRRVHIFDHNWNRQSSEEFTGNAVNYQAIAATDTEWVLLNDGSNRLEFWSFAGVENVSKRHFLGTGDWRGIFTDGTYIYAINDSNNTIQRRTYSSTTLTAFKTLGTGAWRSGTSTSTRFVVLDNFRDNDDAHFYNHSGEEQTSEEINLPTGDYQAALAIEEPPDAVLTISTSDDIRAGGQADIDVVSDIDIAGVTASDFTVTNGTRGTLTRTDAKNYVLAVTAGLAGTMTVSIGEDAVLPGNAAVSKDFTVKSIPTSIPVITKLQPQYILTSTDFDIQILISNSPDAVEMSGSLNSSGYQYDSNTEILHFRGNIEGVISDQTAKITARNAVGSAVPVDLIYSTVPPAPIISVLGPFHIKRGSFFDILIPVQNVQSADVFGLLTFLNQETLADDHAVRVFGTIPVDAEFTTMRGTWRITADHVLGPVVGTVDFFIQDEDFVFMPDAPTGVVADGNVGGGSVELTWKPVPGISHYEYRVGTGDWINVGNMLTAVVTGLTNRVTYNFYVRAIDGHGTPSNPSAVVSAFPVD